MNRRKICFVSLQDCKMKKLELVLPTSKCMASGAMENKTPIALKCGLIIYFIFLASFGLGCK